MHDTATQRLAILEILFAAFNSHDADRAMPCFDPGIVFDAALGRHISGADAVRQAFVDTWTVMPDVAWQVRRHAVFGDHAISEWLFVATAPGGGRIEAEKVDLFESRGNRILRKSAFRKDRPAQNAA